MIYMPGQLIHPHVTVTYNTFDASRVSCGEYVDSKYSSGQKVAYIKYNHCNLQLQSPNIHLFTYGIPKEDKQYHRSDRDRCHIKIPEDINDPKSVLFFSKLQELDKYFDNDDFRVERFGKNAKLYKYVPIVRDPHDNEEADPSKPKRPRYIKVKIDSDWKTNTITSKCFVMNDDARVPVTVESIDDLRRYANYKSYVRMLIHVNKSYMCKSKLSNTEFRTYGTTLKLNQILCEPNVHSCTKSDSNEDQFIDED